MLEDKNEVLPDSNALEERPEILSLDSTVLEDKLEVRSTVGSTAVLFLLIFPLWPSPVERRFPAVRQHYAGVYYRNLQASYF